MTRQRTAEQKMRVVQRLWQLGPDQTWRAPHLYFLIDAARDRRIYPKLVSWQERVEIVSLYQGALAGDLAEVAPYLLCLGSDSMIFDWLWEQGWNRSWGVFLWCRGQNVQTLRDHFRRLTMVEAESVGPVMFRFYDPRVLCGLIPTCSSRQLAQLFGPVRRFVMEANSGTELAEFLRDESDSVTKTSHALAA